MKCDLVLEACDGSTLAGYLKGMGAFRILAEQHDPSLRIYWQDNLPHLVFSQPKNRQNLLDFFFKDYRPTPIVIPWSGNDFFTVNDAGNPGPYKKPPTKNNVIEAFIASPSPRLETYQVAISRTLEIINHLHLSKKKIEGPGNRALKAKFMALLRSKLPDEMVEFMDVAAIIGEDKFMANTLLGSGGGSDGNLHFGGNYMQCLWLCLPDFDYQRAVRLGRDYKEFDSQAAFEQSLFGDVHGKVVAVSGDSPGLFYPGGVGGVNAFEGFEAKSIRNPWEFIFLMEGLLMFSGALSRRSGSRGAGVQRRTASFPFTCRVSYSGATSLLLKETGNYREVWLPLWNAPALVSSVKTVFSEGRAEISGRQAKNGLDFVRAVASLGVDRGISEFRRFGLVKGRVGGENYHTSVGLGSMKTVGRPLEHIRLLDDLDQWLYRLRRSCGKPSSAARYGKHLRTVEASLIDFCKLGGIQRLQRVLLNLGRAERSFSYAGENRPVKPLYVSPEWIKACDDGSSEYRIACALASIYDKQVGPIRVQMEPIQLKQGLFASWSPNRKDVSWRKGGLNESLREILMRRMMEGVRSESEFLPIRGRVRASLSDVHLYLGGYLNEEKLTDLLWALITVKWWEYQWELHAPLRTREHAPELSRLYTLLKLVHLPGNLYFDRSRERGRWTLTQDSNEGTRIPPVLEVTRLLQAGRVPTAVERVFRRLRASGLKPLGMKRGGVTSADLIAKDSEVHRIAGALMIPVWEVDVLARSSLRTPA